MSKIKEGTLFKITVSTQAGASWTRYWLGFPDRNQMWLVLCQATEPVKEGEPPLLGQVSAEFLKTLIKDFYKLGQFPNNTRLHEIKCEYAGVRVGTITIEKVDKAILEVST